VNLPGIERFKSEIFTRSKSESFTRSKSGIYTRSKSEIFECSKSEIFTRSKSEIFEYSDGPESEGTIICPLDAPIECHVASRWPPLNRMPRCIMPKVRSTGIAEKRVEQRENAMQQGVA
jgi:hypothetical protein